MNKNSSLFIIYFTWCCVSKHFMTQFYGPFSRLHSCTGFSPYLSLSILWIFYLDTDLSCYYFPFRLFKFILMSLDKVFEYLSLTVKWGCVCVCVCTLADLSAWHQWDIRRLQVTVTVMMNWVRGSSNALAGFTGRTEQVTHSWLTSHVEKEIKRGETGLSTAPLSSLWPCLHLLCFGRSDHK